MRFWRHRRNRAAETAFRQEQLFRQDILQQRIRSGYTPREMAALMGTTEEWVRDFEDRLLHIDKLNPTLAEIRSYLVATGSSYYVIFREVEQ